MAQDDFDSMVRLLRECMAERGFPYLLLTSQMNFAGLASDRGQILLASEDSCASILLSPDMTCLLTKNIEARQLREEELWASPGSSTRRAGMISAACSR